MGTLSDQRPLKELVKLAFKSNNYKGNINSVIIIVKMFNINRGILAPFSQFSSVQLLSHVRLFVTP